MDKLLANPSLTLDIVFLVIILIFVLKAYFNGFVTSLINLLGNIASFFGANYLSKTYAPVVFEKFLRNSVITRTFNILSDAIGNIDITSAVKQILPILPDSISSSIAQKVGTSVQGILTPSMDTATSIVDKYIASPAISFIKIVSFIAIFLILSVTCKFLAKLFKNLNDVPVLGSVNKGFGIALGLVNAIIIIMLLSFLFNTIVTLSNNSLTYINSELLENSKVLLLFRKFNPLLDYFKELI